MSYTYAITLRKTVSISVFEKQQVLKLLDRYESSMNYLKSLYYDLQVQYSYEIVSKNNNKINLHLHGMIRTSTPYQLLHVPRPKGYSLMVEECNSVLAWEIYIAKEPFSRDDVLEYIDAQTRIDLLPDTSILSEFQKEKVLLDKLQRIRIV